MATKKPAKQSATRRLVFNPALVGYSIKYQGRQVLPGGVVAVPVDEAEAMLARTSPGGLPGRRDLPFWLPADE